MIGLVEEAKLSMGHARALIGHDDAVSLAQTAVRKSLSVREEQLAKGGRGPHETGKGKRAVARSADIAAVQRHLEGFSGFRYVSKRTPTPARAWSRSDTKRSISSI